jgi:MFS family permease
VLSGAIFLEGIGVSMMNVALPAVRDGLGLSTAMLSGVVSAYVLGYAGFMLLGGRAADLLGRRRMFLLWLAIFLVFSAFAGLTSEGWLLLVSRFVAGVAAAFMTPAGLSLVTATFEEGPMRERALMIYSGIAAGGFSLGLVAGGLLTSIGWRWVFFVPAALAGLILIGGVALLRDSAPPRVSLAEFDLPGAFTGTGAMVLLAYGLVRLERPGDGPVWTVLTFAGGIVLTVLFVRFERRAANPLLRLGLLRTGPVVRTNLAALLFLAAFGGFQFLITLYLQELRGWTPLQTGLAMLVIGLDMILTPTVTPLLVARFGNIRVLFGGLVLAALGYLAFLPAGIDWTYAVMLPSFLLLGLAFSFVYGPLTVAAVDGVDEAEHGVAGGLLYSAMWFGTALGVSAVTAVVLNQDQLTIESLRSGLAVPVVVATLAAVVVGTAALRRTDGSDEGQIR